MKLRSYFLLVSFFMLVFITCSKEKKHWKMAKSMDTIQAYQEFIKIHPESPLVDSAHVEIARQYFTKAESLNTIVAYNNFLNGHSNSPFADSAHSHLKGFYEERHPSFKETKKIMVVIKESYEEAPDVSLPFYELVQMISEYAGLEVARADDNDFDVSIKICAKGHASRDKYNIGYQYSGAKIAYKITLELSGKSFYKKSFKYSTGHPSYIKRSYPSPSSAPFGKAFARSFIPTYLEMMGKFYGYHCIAQAALITDTKALPEALKYYDDFWNTDLSVRKQAREILEKHKYKF